MEMRKRNMKGILLTLLTVVLFVLMVTELIAYVVANINYGNLVSQSVFSGSASAQAESLSASISSTMHSAVSSALYALTVYESNAMMRNANFINSSTYALSSLMLQGNVFGTNMSSYIGGGNLGLLVTGQNEIGTFAPSVVEKSALAHGINLTVYNGTLSIYQTSPFSVNATFSGVIAVNASAQLTATLPISSSGYAALNGTTDLSSIQAGYPTTIKTQNTYPSASLVGGTFANYGSTGPYMFAYGPAIVIGGSPSCSNIPAAYQNANYILVAKSSLNIPASLCGMAGLVTNTPNSITPLAPYLVYNAPSVFNSIQNGTSLLLSGPSLALYNVSGISAAIQNGYYYPSPYTPSYLQRIQGTTSQGSPYGMFSFAPLNRPVAKFNGANSVVIMNDQAILDWPTNSLTIGAWVYWPQSAVKEMLVKNNAGNTGPGSYELFQSNQHVAFRLYKGGTPYTLFSARNLSLNSWHQVFGVYNGSVMKIYIDGVQDSNTMALAGPYTSATGEFTMGAYGNLNYPYNGLMSDVQIYFANLSGQQISQLYQGGLNGAPLTANIVGWWPLAGSTADYYSSVPLTQSYAMADNIIYSPAVGYVADPTSQRQLGQSASYASTYIGNAMVTSNGVILGLTNTLTVSVWVNLRPNAHAQVTARNGQFSLQDVSGVFRGWINVGSSWVNANVPSTYGQWTNYILSYNSLASQAIIYKNGAPSNPITVTGTLTWGDGTTPQCELLYFGSYCAGIANVVGGSISNVQVYNRSVNAMQAVQLYSLGISGGPLPNMGNVGWWPLNNNTLDYSPKQNNGAATNAIFTPIPSDPTPDVIQGVLNCANINACSNQSAQHLYLDTLPLSNANGGYANETAALGLQRAGIPDALNVTGINSLAYSNVGSYFGNNNPMSFSAWYYATATSGGPIVGLASSTSSSGWNSPVLSASGLNVYGWVYAGSGSTAISHTLATSGWHNLVITYNPASGGTQTFYIDGSLIGSNTGSYSGSGATDYWTTYVPGVAHSSGGGYFQGMMSDVQFYNVTLGAGQVQSLYLNDSIPSIAANQVFRWGPGSSTSNLANQTQDSVQGDVAYFATGNAIAGVNACTNSNAVTGICGVSIVPP
ncbi:MAG: hypothetical protein KGH98_02155 [Candidatus Micrarchaeota archaeon]|nr:hypothetical protein [Candidatus Micrarchaeota archaeon]